MLNNDGCIEGYEAGLWKFEDDFSDGMFNMQT